MKTNYVREGDLKKVNVNSFKTSCQFISNDGQIQPISQLCSWVIQIVA